jgi:hypothetical protein
MEQETPAQPGTWQVTVFLAYASEDDNLAVAVQAAINKHGTSESGTIAVKKWQLNSEFIESILGNVLSGMREREFGVLSTRRLTARLGIIRLGIMWCLKPVCL